MLTYEPGDSFAHRLDPRAKLGIQVAFAAAAFAYTTPLGLAVLGLLALGCLRASNTSVRASLSALKFAVPFLLLAPVVEAFTLGSPWVVPSDAIDPALASVRVALVFFVAAAYVRTTPIRESRAAIQRLVPGRIGTLLGVGVSLVFRFLPLVRRDLLRVREAQAARLGTERRLDERLSLVAAGGLRRSFARADALSLALRARCFAWNPTLPELRFGRRDVPALALAAGLGIAAILPHLSFG